MCGWAGGGDGVGGWVGGEMESLPNPGFKSLGEVVGSLELLAAGSRGG